MHVLRDDEQVQLNKLHVMVMKSSDHYLHAADILNDKPIVGLFESLAEIRSSLAQEIEAAIRDSEDLPTEPNAGKEVYEHVLQKLEALFSADEVSQVISQSLESEAQLEQALKSSEMLILDKNHSKLRFDCLQSVLAAKEKLHAESSL